LDQHAQADLNSLPTAGDVYHQAAHHGNTNSVIAIANDANPPAEEPVAEVANAAVIHREASLAMSISCHERQVTESIVSEQ